MEKGFQKSYRGKVMELEAANKKGNFKKRKDGGNRTKSAKKKGKGNKGGDSH